MENQNNNRKVYHLGRYALWLTGESINLVNHNRADTNGVALFMSVIELPVKQNKENNVCFRSLLLFFLFFNFSNFLWFLQFFQKAFGKNQCSHYFCDFLIKTWQTQMDYIRKSQPKIMQVMKWPLIWPIIVLTEPLLCNIPGLCYVFKNLHTYNWRPFISEILYLHQTFTDCISNQYTHFDMLTYQMKLQVTDGSLV